MTRRGRCEALPGSMPRKGGTRRLFFPGELEQAIALKSTHVDVIAHLERDRDTRDQRAFPFRIKNLFPFHAVGIDLGHRESLDARGAASARTIAAGALHAGG